MLLGGSPAELKARIEVERRGAPFLAYRDAFGAQHILELGAASRVTVGRQVGNDLALSWDAEVSRVHAAFERVAGAWTLVDDGVSRNGTYVSGVRVQGRRRLQDGDVVRFGRTSLAFREPLPAASTATEQELTVVTRVSESQRRVLVALCRPFAESGFAAPPSNQQIADELFLSVHAVKTHLQALFQAFGVGALPQNQKRAALARRALEGGAVSLGEQAR